MEKIELNIGDKLISDSTYHGLSIVTIERVTKTTAVLSDGSKLRLPLQNWQSAIGSRGFGAPSYRIPTYELLNMVKKQNLVRKLEKVVWKNLSIDQLESVSAILSPSTDKTK